MRHLGFALNISALGLFFPGILLPMFSLNMELIAAVGKAAIDSPLVSKELSIMAAVQELWQDDRLLVSALIFFFSVVIPLLKALIVSVAYFQPNVQRERRLVGFVSNIGKWSMADVFVVAVFLAVLSTNHAETSATHELIVFGFRMAIEVSTQTLSMVGQGFYFFLAYCLVSLAGTHLYCLGAHRRAHEQGTSPDSI
ncbi:Paraquat-inducible protein A [Alteromonas sediminis]|uniref:Paraquat-inducible protein A n=1 Tax=Alteromonas sediminis TaxID=2259342 RepID=A0A3N5YAP3_9ALTE|nr:paraquat-inducible protein A [Alteromonas sediminis]RPJ65895.1 Paraquat-inducible protein A [Alteromonas sediminis]